MTKTNLLAAGICAVLMMMGVAARAQSSDSCTTPVALGALSLGPLPEVGAPYTATVTTTQDRILADGSTVHGSVITYQARDAAGRLWQKRSLGCQPGPDGVRRPVLQTMVSDPGKGNTISWMEDDPAKVLHVVHDRPRTPLPPPATDARSEAAARRAMEKMGIHTEDLGSKKIAGLMADGTRTVQTVPAGQAGINQPIKIVREQWIAKDLDLTTLSIEDNSKTGRRMTEVVDLKQGDPNPALFTPPTGYSVVDNKPAQ